MKKMIMLLQKRLHRFNIFFSSWALILSFLFLFFSEGSAQVSKKKPLAKPQAKKQLAIEPQMIGPGIISTNKSEFKPRVTADGKTLFFARSDSNFTNQKIYVAKFVNGKWQRPVKISFSNDLYDDSDPFITENDSALYFISNRPVSGSEKQKNYDIWTSEFINGKWSQPTHLPGQVNSEADEFGPSYHEGKIYFNSFREVGIGMSDLYYAEKDSAGNYIAHNMGKGINTARNEFDPVVSPDGKYFLFSSWKYSGSLGQSDLYICLKKDSSWSRPVNLGSIVNSRFEENSASFSDDSKYIYFSSNRFDDSKPLNRKSIYNALFNMYRVPLDEVIKNLKFE